ncbi:MAG: hypothetical protein WAM14_02090 [Candidatus Nitrosopolaris sp.]
MKSGLSPPGSTSVTDTLKILHNWTAAVIIPAHVNYTKIVAANQTFTIAPGGHKYASIESIFENNL